MNRPFNFYKLISEALANGRRHTRLTISHYAQRSDLSTKLFFGYHKLRSHVPERWKRLIPRALKLRTKTLLTKLQSTSYESSAYSLASDNATMLSSISRGLLSSWLCKTNLLLDYVIVHHLLKESGLFENEWYRDEAALAADADPIEHYISYGWQTGSLEPSTNFDGQSLYKFYQTVGFDESPALTFVTLRANGWPVYRTLAQAEEVANAIRSSRMFNAKYYVKRAGNLSDRDPVLHYVIVGERMGYAPSDHFDPAYYMDRYPDVAISGMNLLFHYIKSGSLEGRRAKSVASELSINEQDLDPKRETILIIVHQATRTGAPILAYNIALQLRKNYNVVSLLLEGGDLVETFRSCSDEVIGPLRQADWHPVEMDYLIDRLLARYQFVYAIANSIDSRLIMKPLTCAFVPVVALVHEFANHLSPVGEMGRALEWATKVVFSATRVAASVQTEYPSINSRRINVLPQGPCIVPRGTDKECEQDAALLQSVMRPLGSEDALVVLGCGTIYERKGVDLFISCAAAVAALNSKRPIRFVWIGRRLPENIDRNYYTTLIKQIASLGLQRNVVLVDEVTNLEAAYALADVFFLSSRLDPLPNVAIDSALRGLPVVCFEKASGFADILNTDATTKAGVVGELDIRAAADLIVKLAADDAALSELNRATRRLAEVTFDMEHYIKSLDYLGREGAQEMLQRRADYNTIKDDPTFNFDLAAEPDILRITRDEAICVFLARAAVLGGIEEPSKNFYYRRPCPGFHPQIYFHDNANSRDIMVNPLAHFIRSGKPDGPWKHSVITPSNIDRRHEPVNNLRTALHVHFHYPELHADFLAKINSNNSRCDLLLTTNDKRKAAILRSGMTNYANGKVVIRVVHNRGRDIGAFLTGFGEDIAENYEIIGHLHSKRSLFTGTTIIGDRWREFLWQNLLGGLYPMMDIILGRLNDDSKLGIVFADDPHLADWDFNLNIAEQLAQRMGMKQPLPPFFDFPVGTMFWARTRALTPLLKLKLRWSDYPKEPVPIDGTILHAAERLLPFVAREQGYHYASTHIPGITW
jgi:glycosyltransferase involved in cell wall biosynthesis